LRKTQNPKRKNNTIYR